MTNRYEILVRLAVECGKPTFDTTQMKESLVHPRNKAYREGIWDVIDSGPKGEVALRAAFRHWKQSLTKMFVPDSVIHHLCTFAQTELLKPSAKRRPYENCEVCDDGWVGWECIEVRELDGVEKVGDYPYVFLCTCYACSSGPSKGQEIRSLGGGRMRLVAVENLGAY